MEIPSIIYIETTNLCNGNCIMCPYKHMSRKKGIMDDTSFKKIIDSLINYDQSNDLKKTKIFLHKEGEPLCDKNIANRIGYVKSKLKNAEEIALNTNAMLLDENKSLEILNSGLDTIYFSLDGNSSETYNRIRVNLDYNIVLNNILYFLELKGKLNNRIKVIMQMLVCEINEHEKQDFIDKWSNFDVELYIKRMHNYLDGGHTSFDKTRYVKQINTCEDPFRMIVVYWDGNTGCCCWDYNNEYCLGNVKNDSVISLYNGEKIKLMKKMQIEKKCESIIPCNRCMRIFGNDIIVMPKQKN